MNLVNAFLFRKVNATSQKNKKTGRGACLNVPFLDLLIVLCF
ncbi:hypothetical protein CHCC16736_4629 [Bacillus licheniformis]|uniref:Uncharacterized protein n=1 Tax=Bacillus licheniformis TaxID=1402 RepID=A0A8B5YFS7_BACLI|nr:hypothetical protein CHCC20442_3939 [Bacillus licheniformis]TWL31007.1 hypothetical protein CHCC16736_4629 [Bacillus licheniformis]TWM17402.1 hypothetical protein CHCC15087_3777 [Bacillus licheniformis]TWM71169.1 hypothetical protein CHCC14813_3840 [Bacillus licheniformis]TWM93712.1 hypothetical protein CHCC14598_1407 [Bacillus licheniformis]